MYVKFMRMRKYCCRIIIMRNYTTSIKTFSGNPFSIFSQILFNVSKSFLMDGF